MYLASTQPAMAFRAMWRVIFRLRSTARDIHANGDVLGFESGKTHQSSSESYGVSVHLFGKAPAFSYLLNTDHREWRPAAPLFFPILPRTVDHWRPPEGRGGYSEF